MQIIQTHPAPALPKSDLKRMYTQNIQWVSVSYLIFQLDKMYLLITLPESNRLTLLRKLSLQLFLD